MRRLLAISLLGLCLSTPVLAGDVPFPPVPPAPPCAENCKGAPTSSPVPQIVIDLVLSLITFRP